MTGENRKTSGIEKFDGTDFEYCKMQIEDYLYGKKLHLPRLGKKPDIWKMQNGLFLIDRCLELLDYLCQDQLRTMLRTRRPQWV
jgi:hypothetical protein